MLRPRIIPCLLIQDSGLVKTVRFKDSKYVGDPINAVKIFNEKEADELIVIDIDATAKGREPDYQQIAHLASECRMPLCYGGGVRTAEQAKRIIALGVEKVAISSAALANPALISEIAAEIGRQSVVVVLSLTAALQSRIDGVTLLLRAGVADQHSAIRTFEYEKTASCYAYYTTGSDHLVHVVETSSSAKNCQRHGQHLA